MSVSLRNKRIWVAGHTGLVGSALVQILQKYDCEVLRVDRAGLDLRDQSATDAWIGTQKPDMIIMAAATVGGIEANRTRPADFIYDNMMMATNVIHAAASHNVSKLLFLGSSCLYPRHAPQPLTPDALLSGPLESTNESYALAKIAGIKLCQSYRAQHGCNFIAAIPCNLYGPGDRFDAMGSHVIPALMMKLHQARLRGDTAVTLWGTGTPLREFLHVKDLAAGLVTLLQDYNGAEPVNIGSGAEISIRDLACLMAEITGFSGDIHFDPAMPDGTPRKILDSTMMHIMGWKSEMGLRDGLAETYEWYCKTGLSHAA